jgi:hypothetical protein
LRAYKVILDGVEVGKIRDGETVDFSVSPGHHKLRIKISWTGSDVLIFNMRSDDTVVFECEPNGEAMTATFDLLATLRKGGRAWVSLRRISEDQSLGQLSADGDGFWNGSEWVPARSADGRMRWTGDHWEATDA